MKHTLKEIVTGTTAKLTHVCEGIVYYEIEVGDSKYQMSLDSNDDEWKATFLLPEFKAITLMRWIRRSIIGETDSFIQIK